MQKAPCNPSHKIFPRQRRPRGAKSETLGTKLNLRDHQGPNTDQNHRISLNTTLRPIMSLFPHFLNPFLPFLCPSQKYVDLRYFSCLWSLCFLNFLCNSKFQSSQLLFLTGKAGFTGNLLSLNPELSKNTTETEAPDKNQGSTVITVVYMTYLLVLFHLKTSGNGICGWEGKSMSCQMGSLGFL